AQCVGRGSARIIERVDVDVLELTAKSQRVVAHYVGGVVLNVFGQHVTALIQEGNFRIGDQRRNDKVVGLGRLGTVKYRHAPKKSTSQLVGQTRTESA